MTEMFLITGRKDKLKGYYLKLLLAINTFRIVSEYMRYVT